MCRIEVTPSGILQFEKVAEPFFFDYLQSMEPIAVSDQMLYSGSEIQLNLTGNTFGFNSNAWIRKKDFGLTFSSSKTKDMSLSSVDWSIFSFQISQGEGFVVVMQGLQAILKYTMYLSITFPPSNDNWSGNATLNDTDVSFTMKISENGGKPNIEIQDLTVTIGSLDLDLPE